MLTLKSSGREKRRFKPLRKKNQILAKQKKSKCERTVRGNWHPRKKPPRPSFDSFLLSLKCKPQHH